MAGATDHFMAQQGFREEETSIRRWHFRALQLQPVVIALTVLAGIILQSAILFFALAAILLWNVVLPRLNVFERFYDLAVGRRKSKPRLAPAPAPRRFAQGMAATFMAVIAISLTLGWPLVAYIFEGFVAVALTALIAGKFCMGSYIFLALTGRRDFANSTCPWSK